MALKHSQIKYGKFIIAILSSTLMILIMSGCSDSSYEVNKCDYPENPYDEGSGHYAGYEWAQENGQYCDGNSDSFNEGCQEYYNQQDAYDKCMNDNQS